MSEDRQKVGASIAWMAMGNWVEQGFNVLVFIILARILGVDAFGFIAMAAAIVILCEFLLRETLTEYLVASPDEEQTHIDAVFFSLLGFAALLFGGLWFSAGGIAALYNQEIVGPLVQYLGVSVILVALGAVPASLLRRHMQFKVLAIRAVAGVVVGGVVAIWMALAGYGVWALVAQRVTLLAVNTVLAWAAVSWRPTWSFSVSAFKDIFGLGRSVLALRGAQIARVQVPMALIGALLGPTVLGFFSLAWRLVEIASFLVSTATRMVSQSAFAAQMRAGRPSDTLLIELSCLSGWIAIPALTGLSVLSVPIVGLVFGEKWLLAASALSVIGIVGAYLAIEMIHQSYCLAARKIGGLAIVAWIEVAVGAACVIALHQYGLIGVSVGFVASFLALWIIRFGIVSRLSGVSILTLLRQHLAPLMLSALMAFIVTYVVGLVPHWSDIATVALGSVIGAGIYVGLSFVAMSDRIALARQYFLKS